MTTGAASMRAALFRRFGGPEVVEVGEVARPVPAAGEVLVRVRAAALNHFDLWLRQGLPALRVPLPHVPGGDACGVIEAVGAEAAGFAVGDRVVVNPGLSCGRCIRCLSGEDNLCPEFRMVGEHTWGGEAEYLVLPPANLVKAPPGIDDTELAAIPTTFLTAWQMLVDKAKVGPGATVLVLAAASGVGVAAVQIAKLFGARVLAAASSAEKLACARQLGADEAIDYSASSWADEVKRRTGKAGADIVIDHVGGETFATAVKLVAKGGSIVTCGATAGFEPTLNLRYVFWRQISVLGSTMAPKGRLHRILGLVGERRLRAVVDRVIPLEAGALREAHRRLEGRGVIGKIVVSLPSPG